MFNTSDSIFIYVAFGSLILFSHSDIMPFDTPIFLANCGWVNSFSSLSSLILSPNPLILPPLRIILLVF